MNSGDYKAPSSTAEAVHGNAVDEKLNSYTRALDKATEITAARLSAEKKKDGITVKMHEPDLKEDEFNHVK